MSQDVQLGDGSNVKSRLGDVFVVTRPRKPLTSMKAPPHKPLVPSNGHTEKPEGVSHAAHHTKMFSKKLLCGLVSGCCQAGILNPWDRALFLAVKHHRPLFTRENWCRPYQGVWQTLVQRAFSSGIYFPLEDTFRTFAMHYWSSHGEPFTHGVLVSFCVGLMAGTVSALVLNPLSVVKYHTWGRPDVGNFWRSTQRLYKNGGLPVFMKGALSGTAREISFATTFCLLRTQLRKALKSHQREHRRKFEFFADSTAAFIATGAAAPANYVRTMQFAARSHEPVPSAVTVFREMFRAANAMPTLYERLVYISMRLRVTAGATRVAIGMAISSQLYQYAKEHFFEDKLPGPESEME